YNGLAFTITFDFTGTTLPSQIIYGVSYNTLTWGYNPIGVDGPYESLNFGVTTAAPSTGSNPFPDTAYWNTNTAGNYADGGAGGTGTFRRDTGWTPFSGAISFEVAPSFGSCLKDNTTGDFIQWNTTTGDYQFTHCGANGFTLSGTGQVSLVGGIQWLKDKKADRIISVGMTNGGSTGSGNVTRVYAPGVSQNFRINDTIPGGTCACN